MKTITYFILCSLFVISSCKKKDDDHSSANSVLETYSLNIDSGWSMKARINGIDYSISEGNGATGFFSNNSLLLPPDSVMYNYGSELMDGSSTFEVWLLGHIYPDGQPMQDQDFLNFFAPRNYSYSMGVQNRVSIHWTDDSGVEWGSDINVGQQGGSEFRIVEVKQVPGIPDFRIKVYCRFRCFLYNYHGDAKILNNGEFAGVFKPMY